MNKTKSNIRESATESANKTRNQNEININRAKIMNLKAGKKKRVWSSTMHFLFFIFFMLPLKGLLFCQ